MVVCRECDKVMKAVSVSADADGTFVRYECPSKHCDNYSIIKEEND